MCRRAAQEPPTAMDVQIIDADLTNPAHRAGIVDVLNAYACDPAGGAEPLSAEVRQQLVRGLEAHPTSVVLLAIADQRPIGIAVCFLGFSTFFASSVRYISHGHCI